MKEDFNAVANETYQDRYDRLQKQADALDEMLRTPPSQGMHLRPDGQIRRDGDEAAREMLSDQKIDLEAEMERLQQESHRDLSHARDLGDDDEDGL